MGRRRGLVWGILALLLLALVGSRLVLRAAASRAPVQQASLLLFGGRIHGIVYEDLDLDGVFDIDELGLEGATILLYNADTNQLVSTDATGPDGLYDFSGAAPGNYRLQEINPLGFISTTPDSVLLPRLGEEGGITWHFGDVRAAALTPTASPSATASATLTPTSVGSPTSTATPSVTLTPTAGPSPTASDTAVATSTATVTRTPSTTLTPSQTLTPSATATRSRTPTATLTVGPSPTSTQTPESWIDIRNAISAYCRGTFYGDTTGKANNAHDYGNPLWPETGPEDVYRLTKSVTSDVTVTLECVAGDDLDVFLLFGPYPEAVLAQGDSGLAFPSLAPGTYYIVVDGYNGDMGPYRLSVYCEGEPTITPTHTLWPTATNTPVFNYAPLIWKLSTPVPTQTLTPSRTATPPNTATPSRTPTRTVTRTATATRTPTATATGSPYELAVDCGSTAGFWATDDSYYAPDQPFTTGSWGWQGGTLEKVWTTTHEIYDTDDDPLYQSQRYTVQAYYFTVPSGRYEVLLRFAEIFQFAHVGDRVFAVRIENALVLDEYDLLAKGPLHRAWDELFEVNVEDGLLAITFESQSPEYTPAINAIRVRRVGESN